MAYADEQGMSTGRIVAIALVILLHAFLGWAFVTGLAFEAVKKVATSLEAADIKEDEPEVPPPPPPPEPEQAAEAVIETTITPIRNDRQQPRPPEPADTNRDDGVGNSGNQTKSCPDGSVVPLAAACPVQMKQCQFGPPVPVSQQCGDDPDPPATCPSGTELPGGGTQTTRSRLGSCKTKAPPPAKRPKPVPKNNRASWVTTADYPTRALQREEQGVTSLTLTVGPAGKVTGCSGSGSGSAELDAAACKKASARAKFDPALDSNGNPTTGTYSTSVRWQIPK